MSGFIAASLIYGGVAVFAGSFGFLIGTLLQSTKVSTLYRQLELAEDAVRERGRHIVELSAMLERAEKAASLTTPDSENSESLPKPPPKVRTKARQEISGHPDQ